MLAILTSKSGDDPARFSGSFDRPLLLKPGATCSLVNAALTLDPSFKLTGDDTWTLSVGGVSFTPEPYSDTYSPEEFADDITNTLTRTDWDGEHGKSFWARPKTGSNGSFTGIEIHVGQSLLVAPSFYLHTGTSAPADGEVTKTAPDNTWEAGAYCNTVATGSGKLVCSLDVNAEYSIGIVVTNLGVSETYFDPTDDEEHYGFVHNGDGTFSVYCAGSSEYGPTAVSGGASYVIIRDQDDILFYEDDTLLHTQTLAADILEGLGVDDFCIPSVMIKTPATAIKGITITEDIHAIPVTGPHLPHHKKPTFTDAQIQVAPAQITLGGEALQKVTFSVDGPNLPGVMGYDAGITRTFSPAHTITIEPTGLAHIAEDSSSSLVMLDNFPGISSRVSGSRETSRVLASIPKELDRLSTGLMVHEPPFRIPIDLKIRDDTEYNEILVTVRQSDGKTLERLEENTLTELTLLFENPK